MKPGGSNRKGSSFERKICKSLSLWISHGERDDLFWRTAMSGGRATIGLAKGIKRSAQEGDIGAITGVGEKFLNTYLVECKFYKDLQLQHIVTGTGRGNLLKFWKQCRKEAKQSNKTPILIAKQNHLPILWITKDIRHPSITNPIFANNRIISVKNRMIICKFEDVLKEVKYV